MVSKSLGSRALKFAGSLSLCSFAIAAQADPISLEGACNLTSTVPAGQGQCQIQYLLSDSFLTPANIKSAVVKVDGVVVHRYLNDNVNPVSGTVPYVSGSTMVTCGVAHVITAFVTKLGVGTVQIKVGSLPAVLCPVVVP